MTIETPLTRGLAFFREFGVSGSIKILIYRFLVNRYVSANFKKTLCLLFMDKCGLEIGGPSEIFDCNSILPVYLLVGQIDNCNFASQTMWEGKIKGGRTFNFLKGKTGWQFISEATDLSEISTGTYDFVVSSNALEHVANPIRALKEFLRVTKDDGCFLFVLPHKQGTFDLRRKNTTLQHMVDDYETGMDEHDLTHMYEIANTNPEWTNDDYKKFIKRGKENYVTRFVHHHVFTVENALQLFDYLGLQICFAIVIPPNDIAVLCKKSKKVDNAYFFSDKAYWHKLSPFSVDR